MANVEWGRITSNSISVTFNTSGLADMYHQYYLNDVLKTSKLVKKGDTSSSYTFSGLKSGTTYTVMCRAIGANGEGQFGVDFYPPGRSATTLIPTVTCYAPQRDYEIQVGRALPVIQPESGYTFMGWATKPNSLDAEYFGGSIIKEETDYFAVFRSGATTIFKYVNADGKSLGTNYRVAWKIKTSVSRGFTYVMSNSRESTTILTSVPNFNPSEVIIAKSLGGDGHKWGGIGWTKTTTGMTPAFTKGEKLSSEDIRTLNGTYYAIYERDVSVSFDANGGSGSMPNVSAKVYCNPGSKSRTTPTVKIGYCSFIPPKGKMFSHWSKTKTASATKYISWIQTQEDITLYAIWGPPPDGDIIFDLTQNVRKTYSLKIGFKASLEIDGIVRIKLVVWPDGADKQTFYSDYVATGKVTFPGAITATGLIEDTEYCCQYFLEYSSTIIAQTSIIKQRTRIKNPGRWEWNPEIYTGASAQKTEILDNGDVVATFLTASQWNDFVIHCEKAVRYFDESHPNYSDCKVLAGSEMAVTIPNLLRNRVGNVLSAGGASCSTWPAPAAKGDFIKASYFNGLRDGINRLVRD